MTKHPMQANGAGKVVAPDGVSNSAGEGESSGGAYPNSHGTDAKGTFDGGQSNKKYEGPDNPNATTESD